MGKHITVVCKGGKVKVETSGFAGAECQKATEGLERALGKKITDEPKAEMYQTVVEDVNKVGS